ncbi:glycerol-3-phosphate acyltransferase [Acetobacter sp. CAG:977]|mgnify:CR=1 FL=1|nr:glycerol-3-phosphate acyltransferase [Acetobacter sp. CAG:977]
MSDDTLLILSAVLGYLLGSIPFGIVFTRMAGLGDIRKIGSGNIGATNVLRTGRKDLALLTLLCDSGKAALAAGIAYYCVPEEGISDTASLLAGTMGVIGHNFPVWLKFKGGKGVAATLGMMLATCWQVGLAACLTWLVMALLFRYSSLSALTALILAPVYAYFFATPEYVYFYAGLALLSVIRHRTNIARLFKGEESKIKLKKKAE